MFKASVAVAVTTALMLAATAAAASWHVIGKASSRGDFAATAASGQAKHPHQLAVRLTGKGVSGFGAVACANGSPS